MDSIDNEELEKLFHADLQSLYMQREQGDENVTGTELPDWIIGVIVVVILLIIVFFAMVIYSLVKERKKQWAGSYGGGKGVSASICDEPDVGKDDGNIQITSFTVDDGKIKGDNWGDAQIPTIQKRPQTAELGCINRVFVEDEQHEQKTPVDGSPREPSEGSKDVKVETKQQTDNDKEQTPEVGDKVLDVSAAEKTDVVCLKGDVVEDNETKSEIKKDASTSE